MSEAGMKLLLPHISIHTWLVNQKSVILLHLLATDSTFFYNAAALYNHVNSIKDFIKKFPNPKNLVKVVQEDITHDVVLAEPRALEIIDKILTVPLCRINESKQTILDLNPVLLRLKLDLPCLCKDASTVF